MNKATSNNANKLPVALFTKILTTNIWLKFITRYKYSKRSTYKNYHQSLWFKHTLKKDWLKFEFLFFYQQTYSSPIHTKYKQISAESFGLNSFSRVASLCMLALLFYYISSVNVASRYTRQSLIDWALHYRHFRRTRDDFIPNQNFYTSNLFSQFFSF